MYLNNKTNKSIFNPINMFSIENILYIKILNVQINNSIYTNIFKITGANNISIFNVVISNAIAKISIFNI